MRAMRGRNSHHRKRLDVEPARLFVTVTRREKRACRNCKKAGVVTAPVPAPTIERGLASDRGVIDAGHHEWVDDARG